MLFSLVLPALAFQASLALGDTFVTINTNKKLQVIDGFGVSTAYGHAKQFQTLGPGPQKEGLDLLFNTTTGAGLSIIRNKIGCDALNSITNTNTDNPKKQPVFHFDGNDNSQSTPVYMKSATSMGRLCGTPGVSCASGDWRQRYVKIIAAPDQSINTTLLTSMSEGAANDQAFATAWYVNGGSNEGFTWAGVETNNKGSLSHVVDTDGTKFTVSSMLWAIAHWSRHIRPGTHRLSTSGVVQNTIVGAFENVDGSVVMVLTNSGTAAQTVDLGVSGSTFSIAHAFTSDAEAQMVDIKVTLSGGSVKVTVPVHGVVTVKLTTAKTSKPVSTAVSMQFSPTLTTTSVVESAKAVKYPVPHVSSKGSATSVTKKGTKKSAAKKSLN
ncbi:carbohydrate-binding module family 1 [Fusarium agapanthi]|uniref:Carbohydrate-binding module family 1 n=1 Tax=Fusarium agapanthi TaxID=1803897 RepID=A0A9P5EHK2_9HYPO|nr:carbohydrate-binding module family 1 [Fusarium agapanthi]